MFSKRPQSCFQGQAGSELRHVVQLVQGGHFEVSGLSLAHPPYRQDRTLF